MTRSLFLQDFSRPNMAAAPIHEAIPESAPQEDALEAFDRGYKSGWADCVEAGHQEKRGIGAALAQSLSAAQLTEATARRDILAALGPFFEEVVATLLPRIAAEAVGPTVLAEISALADGQLDAVVEVHCAPSDCANIEGLIEDEGLTGVTVRPEPTLGEGQVSVRLGHERRDVDMAGAAERIAEAITGFRAEIPETLPNPNQGVA